MEEIRRELQGNQISISNAIVKLLPELRGRASDETLMWLASELQGYPNPIQFYQAENHNFPSYRVVRGTLKVMDSGGKLSELSHPFALRGQYFLAAPVAWLEDFAALPGKLALVELPDLTAFLGGGRGNIACEFSKDQLLRALTIVRNRVLDVMNQIATKQP